MGEREARDPVLTEKACLGEIAIGADLERGVGQGGGVDEGLSP
jgi:hypothetical protein